MPATALQPRTVARDIDLEEALARYDANLAAFRVISAKMRQPNRAALFDTLAARRISLVVVTIDHDDNGGRIEKLALIAADPATRLPEEPVTLSIPQWGLPDPISLELSVPHAIERMAFDCLEESFGVCPFDHAGSETLIFDVTNRAVAVTKPRQDYASARTSRKE